MRLLGTTAALIGGVMLAVQARLNGRLGSALGDGLLAAVISFGVGLVIMVGAVLLTPSARESVHTFRAALGAGTIRPWQCLGGAAGAFYVTSQGFTVTLLGVAVFTVAVVAGQAVSSLVVDRIGLGPGVAQPITWPRAIGAAMAVVAVGVAVSDRFGTPEHLWLALLPALAGVGMGWQQAVNGRVRVAADGIMFTTMLNFAVGFTALLVAAVVDVAVKGLPAAAPSQWWLYLGGALGIVGVSTSVFAVRIIGVLMVGLAAVAGQLAGALLLDLADGAVRGVTVAGVAITFAAVGVAAMPRRQ